VNRSRALPPLGLLLLVTACGGPPEPAVPPAVPVEGDPPPMVTDAASPRELHFSRGGVAYRCGMDVGFVAVEEGDGVRIHLPGRSLHLPRAQAASGARYASEEGSFWSRDGEAILEIGATTMSGCRVDPGSAPWADARQRGVQFRAVGQEPGWHLEVVEGSRIRFVGDYGEITWEAAAPRPTADPALRWVEWEASERGDLLHVRATDDPCFDVMSGEPFESSVTVRFNNREFRGCGRFLR
jgi:membrane-bound inhibitor of C-type lysozyme/uncharacterized membrane protein